MERCGHDRHGEGPISCGYILARDGGKVSKEEKSEGRQRELKAEPAGWAMHPAFGENRLGPGWMLRLPGTNFAPEELPDCTAIRSQSAANTQSRCAKRVRTRLLQLREFRLCFFQKGDIRIGVLPQAQEIAVSSAGVRNVTLQGVGAGKAKMGERADGLVPDYTGMVQNLLKFALGGCALLRRQIGLAS